MYRNVRAARPGAGWVKDAGMLQDGQGQEQAPQVRAEAAVEASFGCFRCGGRVKNLNLKLTLLASVSLTT